MPDASPRPAAGPTRRPRRRPPALLTAAIASLVVAAAVVGVILAVPHGGGATPAAGQPRANTTYQNPDVDPGTSLPGTAAPGFTLTSQSGARVSLSQFRGRAVVLAFVDARCTTVCPLTTLSMTGALSLLGPAAARHVQLLGIDANPDATTVADVRAYSVAHQMTRSWDFLTGSRAQLDAVWRAYHVYVAASHGNIDHEPAVYLIDPQGRERTLYLTQMAYAGVGQQAQLIADGLGRLLPGHPVPRRTVPMTLLRGIKPTSPASLPVTAGATGSGRVLFGPGHPHVLVFLASWDSEVTDLGAQFQVLAAYQRQAARHGWPGVVVVDEARAETSPAALRTLVARAGGARLGYPVAADTTGQFADGYGVQGLPWIEVTSSSGHILIRHDGWLTASALDRAAGG